MSDNKALNITSSTRIEKAPSWEEFQEASSCFPEYQPIVSKIINGYLGYPVDELESLKDCAFMRALVYSFQNKMLTLDELHQQLSFHVRRIRNTDIKKTCWAMRHNYTEHDHNIYNTKLIDVAKLARERMSNIVGFEPDIEHSLYAELILRKKLSSPNTRKDESLDMFDFNAATVVLYRQILLTLGEDEADNSSLFAQAFWEDRKILPHSLKELIEDNSKV